MAGLRDGHAVASAQTLTNAAELMRKSKEVRHTHTKEILHEGARDALIMMAERIERLERVIAALATEAERDD